MNNNIFILSQPIQTGKTTRLKKWVDSTPNCGGILTPDLHGLRKLYAIAQQQYYPLQVTHTQNTISIGKFLFDISAFTQAQQILLNDSKQHYNWLIVDEVGRLEINQHQGLEPALSQLIKTYQNQQATGNLLLVIRDYLLPEAIEYYQLQHAQIIDFTFLENQFMPPTGLVLCGGKSTRMGNDKAFITYHTKPQYAHVTDMLQPFCQEVFISCNAAQKSIIAQYYQYLEDNATFNKAGPLTGVLTAFNQLSQQALLVVGCDYPYLTPNDIKALLDARQPDIDVVCYKNPESNFEEPLLAIYEKQCAPLLFNFFQSGQQSLRHFLKTVRTKTINPSHIKNITSVDEKRS